MKSKIRRILIVLFALVMCAWIASASASAATTHRPHPRPHPTAPVSPTPTPTVSTPSPTPTPVAATTGPAVPAGYALKYSRNFAHTAGLGDWVVQPGAGAQVTDSTQPGAEFGMGIGMNVVSEWAEVISSNAVVTQNTFVQALVYIPAASGKNGEGDVFPAGSSANWPAFWTFGNPWPQNGEIDALEVQSGKSCLQTHYSATPGSSTEGNSPSYCGPVNPNNYGEATGWTEVSFLRTGQQVTGWYGNIKLGTVTLPTTANEKLVFQNQSYSTSVCAHCFGPTLLGAASTAYLSNVSVYSK